MIFVDTVDEVIAHALRDNDAVKPGAEAVAANAGNSAHRKNRPQLVSRPANNLKWSGSFWNSRPLRFQVSATLLFPLSRGKGGEGDRTLNGPVRSGTAAHCAFKSQQRFCSPFPAGKGVRGIGLGGIVTSNPLPLCWGRGQGLGLCS